MAKNIEHITQNINNAIKRLASYIEEKGNEQAGNYT